MDKPNKNCPERPINTNFEEIFYQSPIGIFLYDKDGRLTNANDSALNIARIPKLEDVLGTNIFDNPIIASKKDEILDKGLIKFQDTLDLIEIKEQNIYNPLEPEIIDIDWIVSITDSGYLIQIQDITNQKSVEDSLKESESNLRSFFDATGDMRGIIEVISDNDIRHIADNIITAGYLGITPDIMRNKLSSELGEPKEIINRWIRHYKESERTGKPVSFEYLDERENKEAWLVATVNYVGTNSQGQSRYGYEVKDITDRKKTENELKRQAALLNLSYEAIFSWDLDKGILSWNKGAEMLYGYSDNEAIGRISHNLLKTQFPIELNELKEILINNKMWTGEITHTTKNGQKIIVETRQQIIQDPSGINVVIETNRDITEKKKAEDKQEKLSKQLQLALDSANMGWWHYNPITNISTYDNRYKEIFGVLGSERPNDEILKLLHPDDLPKVWAEVEKALDPVNPRKYYAEYRIYHNNEIRWIEAHGIATFEGYGESKHAVSLVGTVTDITERKRSEKYRNDLLEKEQQLTEELTASNEELQSTSKELFKSNAELHQYSEMLSTIYELNPDSIVLTTASDSKIIDCNQEYLNQIGYSRDEVIGHTSLELDLISSEESKAYIKETRGKESISNYEGKVKKKDGSYIDVLYSTKLITVNNEPVVLNIGRDVTEKRKVEESLRESEERFHNLADNIPNLAWMADANGWIFWYNKQWYEYTGTTFEEMQGWGWKKVHHPDFVDEVTEEWSTKLLKGEPYDNIFPLKGKDGNYSWFLTRVTPILDEQGKIQRWFGTNTDITNQKIIEENLQTTMNELKVSNKELEQFAYITSHDLREPLRMITSFLQLLERRYKDQLDHEANEFIGFAVDGAKRLDSMTNDLLQYSKITNKKRELIPVNFEHVLEHALTNLKVQIEETNSVITHDPLPTIKGDEQLKIQLFQNIIGNAIKYRSQETPKIHISATKEKNQYLFSIKDNGIGMSKKHLEKIFTIFQRLHTHEEYEGTGIGLAIAQKIVHQQGGQIWAESEPGKGSTFYFTIPNE